MMFQPQERANRPADMIALGSPFARCTALHATKLLQPTMIGLDRPDVLCGLRTTGCYNKHRHAATERITTMTTIERDQRYEQQIKPLPPAVRLQLLARIAQDLLWQMSRGPTEA